MGGIFLAIPRLLITKPIPYYTDLISVFNKVGANGKTCFGCVNEIRNLPLWQYTIINDNANKNLASNLGQIIENEKNCALSQIS